MNARLKDQIANSHKMLFYRNLRPVWNGVFISRRSEGRFIPLSEVIPSLSRDLSIVRGVPRQARDDSISWGFASLPGFSSTCTVAKKNEINQSLLAISPLFSQLLATARSTLDLPSPAAALAGIYTGAWRDHDGAGSSGGEAPGVGPGCGGPAGRACRIGLRSNDFNTLTLYF